MARHGDKTILCRARISDNCAHGSVGDHFPSEDGTYEPETGTVVCDDCYDIACDFSASGRALLAELPEAIEAARRAGGEADRG